MFKRGLASWGGGMSNHHWRRPHFLWVVALIPLLLIGSSFVWQAAPPDSSESENGYKELRPIELIVDAGGGKEAIPPVEFWKKCETRKIYPFFTAIFCLNPDGSGEIGVHAYHGWPASSTFLGKMWGIKKPWGGMFGLDYSNAQAMMVLENGTKFLGARGAEPEFFPIKDRASDKVIGLRIRLRGEKGAVAERIIFQLP